MKPENTPAKLTLEEVATLVGGRLFGDGRRAVTGVASIEDAVEGQLVALDSEKHLAAAQESKASAVLVGPALAAQLQRDHVVIAQPQLALNKVIEKLGLWPVPPKPGVHPTAIV